MEPRTAEGKETIGRDTWRGSQRPMLREVVRLLSGAEENGGGRFIR